jgi:hypothetical protein
MIAISYRRDDSQAVAGRLYDLLAARLGRTKVFMDFESIRPGLDFRRQIHETIDKAEIVVAIIGPNWMGGDGRRIDDPNDFVRLEVAHALQRDIPLIPVLINNTKMPAAESLPEELRGLVYRHALPLDSGMDFHQHAERIVTAICEVLKPQVAVAAQSRKAPAPQRRALWWAAGLAGAALLLLFFAGGAAWLIWSGVRDASSLAVAQPASAPASAVARASVAPVASVASTPASTPLAATQTTPQVSPTPVARNSRTDSVASGAFDSSGFAPDSAAWPGERFPLTRLTRLQMADLQSWDADVLRYAINEMYARGGYDFRTPDVKQTFLRFVWYRQRLVKGRTQDEAYTQLSPLERANLDFLQSLRNRAAR